MSQPSPCQYETKIPENESKTKEVAAIFFPRNLSVLGSMGCFYSIVKLIGLCETFGFYKNIGLVLILPMKSQLPGWELLIQPSSHEVTSYDE